MEKQQQQIQIELDEKTAEGIYSNFVLTAHTASEFVLDFARMVPGVKKAKVFARIIMTPQSAKSLHAVLGRTLDKYESDYGKITLPKEGQAKNGSSIGFQPLPEEEEKKKK
ncbi:DUF3467 domain-containing protein [bacterium]|nr:MAG: DUF3467 domain-containing protein [bacterium]